MAPKRKTAQKFCCKVCSYTDSSQEKIAVHFLQEHMDVDFCSLSHPIKDTENGTNENSEPSALNEKDFVQDEGSTVSVKDQNHNRKRKTSETEGRTNTVSSESCGLSSDTRATVESNISTRSEKRDRDTSAVERKGRRGRKRKTEDRNEKHEGVEDGNELGRGKRRKSTPKRFFTGDEPQKTTKSEKSRPVPRAHLENLVTRRLSRGKEGDVIPSKSTGGDKEEKPAVKVTRQRTLESDEDDQDNYKEDYQTVQTDTNNLKASLQMNEATLSDDMSTSQQTKTKRKRLKFHTDNEGVSETLNKKIKRLPIALEKFKNKLDKMMREWNSNQEQRRENSIRQCSFKNCELKLMGGDMLVHESCHAKSMDGLKCPQCAFMCLHWRHMRKHLRAKHDLSLGNFFVCDQPSCTQSFKRSHQLRMHVMNKHLKEQLVDRVLSGAFTPEEFEFDENKLREEDLPSTTKHKSDLETRKKKKKNDRPPKRKKKIGEREDYHDPCEDDQRNKVTFECEFCSSKFKEEDVMSTHKDKHITNEETILACAECECLFAGSESLKEHYRQHHKSKLSRYQCQECPYATDKFYQMSLHEAMHSGQRGVMCEQCGKWLANQYNLRVHEFRKHCTEEQKKVACSACSYRCADKSILRVSNSPGHRNLTSRQ